MRVREDRLTFAEKFFVESRGWPELDIRWRRALDHGQLWEMLVAELVDGRVSPRGKAGYDVNTWRNVRLEVKHCRQLKGRSGWRVSNMVGKEDCVIFCLNRNGTQLIRAFYLPKTLPRKYAVTIPAGRRRSRGEAFWGPLEVSLGDLTEMFGRPAEICENPS